MKNTGGPAFPQPLVDTNGPSGLVSADEMQVGGMTLRDYFAAKAMQAIIGHCGYESEGDAYSAYRIADSMLKAREER